MPSSNRATRQYRLAQILLRVSMLAGLTLATLTLTAITIATARAADGDPQLPPFAKNIDKETYLKLRSEHTGLLRGWDPGKPFTSAPRIKAIAQMKEQLGSKTLISTGTPWTPIGPAPIPNGQTSPVNPVSGRVTAIVIHPTNPNLVYVGTAQGGVYRTADGGTNWTPIFDSAQSLAIGALALAPSNPSMLYVGTGEANGSNDSFSGVGLYRVDNADTTASLVGPINPVRDYVDAGAVAHHVPVFNGRSISKIVVHPTQPGTVFVGTASGLIGMSGDPAFGGNIDPLSLRGLWRSTNADGALGSIAFSRMKVSVSNACFDNPCTGNRNINDIVMDPSDPTGNTLVVWQNGINVAGDGGVWRSANAMAIDPSSVVFSQTFATTATSTSNGRAAFAFYKPGVGGTVIYEASGEPSSGTLCPTASKLGALRRSIDGGLTWSAKLPGGGGFCGGQCFYDIGLAVVAGGTTATDRIHLGGNTSSAACEKLHGRSLDGGATTFTNFDARLHADVHAIAVAPSDPTQIWHGNDGGIWKSTDSGSTWTSMNNSQFSATQFQSLALHPSNSNFSIGGTQDNGTDMFQPAGTWSRIDFGDGGFSAIDQNAPDTTNVTMYHTYFNNNSAPALIGFARVTTVTNATDGSWSFKGCENGVPANGITCTDNVLFYPPLALGPGNPNTLYFGTDRLYRSTNKGDNNVVVSQAPLVADQKVSAIGISPQDDNYRIVGLTNGKIFGTATGANPLTDITGAGMPAKYVARVVFDPTNKNTAYVSFDGYGVTAGQHVWKTTNFNGTSPAWGAAGNGIPDVPVNALAVDPANSSNVYAGTDIGVYSSTDGGANWAPFGTGLPVVAVFDLAIQDPNRILRIATHGRGMWQMGLGGGGATNFTLTVAKSGTGSGTVASNPAGIACGATCSAGYASGASVGLTATPAAGSTFAGWSNACSGTGACTVTMNSTISVTATFALADDGFPPGGAIPAGWIQPSGSNAPWVVTNDAAYAGSLSLKSGLIGDSQKSEISYGANFSAGNVSFARKVSSELDYDLLEFYIDGVLKNSWSGELEWAVVSFPISAGPHTLLWRYVKDSSDSLGSDAAWIDSVVFPSGVVPVNGACGSSNGGTFTAAPTANLCSSGTATTVSGSGPWSWSCNGSNGGTTAHCSAANTTPAGNADCLFNWAERNFPSFFAPAGAISNTLAPYYYRYYPQTNAYLGTSSADNHVYYLGPLSNYSILDVGALPPLLSTAGCQ